MRTLEDECQRRFYAWQHYHPHEAELPMAAWVKAWHEGGRSALLRSSQFIEMVPRLIELVELLRHEEVEFDLEVMHDER